LIKPAKQTQFSYYILDFKKTNLPFAGSGQAARVAKPEKFKANP
jgi:hypothetical protein